MLNVNTCRNLSPHQTQNKTILEIWRKHFGKSVQFHTEIFNIAINTQNPRAIPNQTRPHLHKTATRRCGYTSHIIYRGTTWQSHRPSHFPAQTIIGSRPKNKEDVLHHYFFHVEIQHHLPPPSRPCPPLWLQPEFLPQRYQNDPLQSLQIASNKKNLTLKF